MGQARMNDADQPPTPTPTPPPPRGTEPYGSIVERFRGTEWDTDRGGLPPPPNPMSRILITIGVVAFIVAGTLVVFGVLGRPPTTAEPSRFIATPQPTPGQGDLVMGAFWQTIEQSDLGYHVDSTASATAGTQKGSLSTGLDVHGDDFSGTLDIKLKGDPLSGRWLIVRSAGIAYLRQEGSTTWASGTANQIELRMAPFLSLVDHRQLRYAGVISEGASTLYRLVSTDLYRPSVSRILPILQPAVPKETFSLELIVTATGRPVRATLTAHADADPAIGAPALDLSATYTFTRLGEVGPISAPKL
jgi:hypothetical protein